jgi:hypothetical protein
MSAGKRVKFAISMKELNVTFEGDVQTAERMHSEVAGALTTLASAQRMLTAPPKSAPPVEINPAAGRRRGGRRRRGPTSLSTEPANSDVAVANVEPDLEPEDEGRVSRRSGAVTFITQLKNEQFFNTKRAIADICQELAKKGHNFRSSEISPVLLTLTQQEILKRDKDPSLNQWVYFAA